MLPLKKIEASIEGTGLTHSGSQYLVQMGRLMLSEELGATLSKQDTALNIKLPIYLRTSK